MLNYFERYDPTKDLDEKINNHIHIYNKQTNGRKSITVVVGLILSLSDEKLFLETAQKRLSTAGYKKIIPEYSSKDESFCFSGDHRTQLKKIIIELFGRLSEDITVH